MIDHVSLVVSDYPAAKAFYAKVLESIGATMKMEFGPEVARGAYVSGWGRDQPTFWIASCPTGEQKSSTGAHVAFTCPDQESVDKFYEAAMAAGGTCNGEPGLRPHYHPGYYGAFVKDLDGHNIEAVNHHPVNHHPA